VIPKIIHYGAFGGWKLSPLDETCKASWLAVNPGWELRFWNDENAPKVEFVQEAIKRKPVLAHHFVEYWALCEFGGYFVDNDVLSIKPFETQYGLVAGFQRDDTEHMCINNAVLGAEKQHPVIRDILKRIEGMDPAGWPLDTGPGMITSALREAGVKGLNIEQDVGDIHVYPKDVFYPWSWEQEPRTGVTERTICCHWWEGSWKAK
jgi:mannosyltransferase OCH1-like enzyme